MPTGTSLSEPAFEVTLGQVPLALQRTRGLGSRERKALSGGCIRVSKNATNIRSGNSRSSRMIAWR